jgi:hypothetical protein
VLKKYLGKCVINVHGKVCLRKRGNGTLTLIAKWAISEKLKSSPKWLMRGEGGERKEI